jgi:hypothetical protein
MRLRSNENRILKAFVLLLALTTALVFAPSTGTTQPAAKLSLQDVIDLLTGDVASTQVAAEAQKDGISFQVTSSVAKQIKDAGGTDDLIDQLRNLAPRSSTPSTPPPNPNPPESPPTLVIDSNPGQSQVYVDDEPVGTTSTQGRLRLSQIPSGQHSVRVSLQGYQDYQETISLESGRVTTVAAVLQKMEVPQPVPEPQVPVPAPSPEPENPAPERTGPAGYLGVLPAPQQPDGSRGVVISGTQPGGPAARAGLKAYDTILSVNGQPTTTAQDLRSLLGQHQVGDVVEITWYNGNRNITRQIRLGTPPTAAQQIPAPNPAPSLRAPRVGVQSFAVAHDHGQSGRDYCTGTLTVGNGVITYHGIRSNTGGAVHNYEIPLDTVREARRNNVYLEAIGAFHIRTKRGTNYNFVVINNQGQYLPPDQVLDAIDNSRN